MSRSESLFPSLVICCCSKVEGGRGTLSFTFESVDEREFWVKNCGDFKKHMNRLEKSKRDEMVFTRLEIERGRQSYRQHRVGACLDAVTRLMDLKLGPLLFQYCLAEG